MAEVIELPEVGIDLGADYVAEEEERRREEEARARALREIQAGSAATSAPAEVEPARPRRPGPSREQLMNPSGYMEAAQEIAPHEVGLGRPGERPATAVTPFAKTPGIAPERARAQAPALAGAQPPPTPTPSSLPGAAASSVPGPTSDKDLERAMGERDERRDRNRIVNLIGALLGGGSQQVAAAVRREGDVNEPLEDLQLRRTEEARRNAEGARRGEAMRGAQERQAEEARLTERRDPNSAVSRSMQDAIARMNIGVTAEQIRGISAEDLEKNGVIGALVQARARTTGSQAVAETNIAGRRGLQDDQQEHAIDLANVNNEVRERIAALRAARRGRGGGGGGGAVGAADVREAFIDTMVSHGMSEEDATMRANALSPRDIRAALRSEAIAVAGSDVRGDAARTRSEEQSQIPGWSRRPDAPEIGVAERTELRGINSDVAALRPSLRLLTSLHQRVSAAERAGARADVLGPLMSQARIAHEQVITALRNIGNYGVPQAAELARMESIAPPIESAAGWVSAGNVYPALEQALDRQVRSTLQAYGYERAQSGSSGNTVRVRHRGRVLSVRRENLERAIADGAEVIDG